VTINSIRIPVGVDEKVFRACEAYMRYAHELLTSYLDALAGLAAVRREVIAWQERLIEKLKFDEPEKASIEYLDSASGVQHQLEGEGTSPPSWLAQMTYGEFKARTTNTGKDAVALGHMLIALLYGAWEDNYRAQISAALRLKSKNGIQHDLFGDLGALRHAVLHNRGIATSKVEQAKILKWFRRQQVIFISAERADALFKAIDVAVTEICGIRMPRKRTSSLP
jgi:hypothetical protein